MRYIFLTRCAKYGKIKSKIFPKGRISAMISIKEGKLSKEDYKKLTLSDLLNWIIDNHPEDVAKFEELNNAEEIDLNELFAPYVEAYKNILPKKKYVSTGKIREVKHREKRDKKGNIIPAYTETIPEMKRVAYSKGEKTKMYPLYIKEYFCMKHGIYPEASAVKKTSVKDDINAQIARFNKEQPTKAAEKKNDK